MSIEEICEKYEIVNYTINDDGTIDVDGFLDLSNKGLTSLPLRFNKVSGGFDCTFNKLTDLEGCPVEVGRNFYCSNNQLTSLEGSPESVGNVFACYNNQLTSLEGCSKSVGRDFFCNQNQITDLKGFNADFKGNFHCHRNPISSIFDGVEQYFIIWFKKLKIIKDNRVDLRRLKYLQTMFDFKINIEEIKKNYTIV